MILLKSLYYDEGYFSFLFFICFLTIFTVY